MRRGPLLVIPIGRALLYAQAIYLQAERSPMPELRLVVLALQDRLVYAPTFEAALANLFGAAGGGHGTPDRQPRLAAPTPPSRAAGGAARRDPGADRRSGEESRGLSAADRRGQAGRSGTEARTVEAGTRRVEQTSVAPKRAAPRATFRDNQPARYV